MRGDVGYGIELAKQHRELQQQVATLTEALNGFAEGMISFGFRGVMVTCLPGGAWCAVMPDGSFPMFASAADAVLGVG